ncbi:TolC family protein [Paucihalobacter sp.]|uniref:TolC family protein n=1 Tax=Paucihalobacter sp. TaxID=2850405 RepID=UPI002FDFC83C
MKRVIYIMLFLISNQFYGQQIQDTLIFNFKEYLGYVKKFHPVAKQAELTIGIGQATLMKARGGFDPKVEVDYNRKEFKDSEYYNELYSTFKIPTWYGIELNANYENNRGEFLNPRMTMPDDGLYSAGISASLLQGLLMNDRMADLKKAKFFREQTKADRDILVNQILYNAAVAYFNWLQAFQEVTIYKDFLSNAETRFNGIKRNAIEGEIAAIDTVEAKIAVQNRKLSLEQANLNLIERKLRLSNFLWLNDDIPVELQDNVIPDINLALDIDSSFEIMGLTLDQFNIENHPMLQSLNFKIESLDVDRRLMANRLLPRLDANYNFLTETPEIARSLNTNNYKGGISFQLPLFLRKERGDLKLARIKVQDAKFELLNTEIEIQNKVITIFNALESFEKQNELIEGIVNDNRLMLQAEERKFSFGESSIFLLNAREVNLIDAELKAIEVQNKYYEAKAKLFNSLSTNPTSL